MESPDAMCARWIAQAELVETGEGARCREISARVVDRWGSEFRQVSVLVEVSIALVQAAVEQLAEADCGPQVHALVRGHARSCRVVREIVTLLGAGYPEGAWARWRTMFETVAVMRVIGAGSIDLARRFLLHGEVERAEFVKTLVEDLGSEAAEELIGNLSDAVQLFEDEGKDFNKPNGWAVGFVPTKSGGSRVTIDDLVRESGLQEQGRALWKLASWCTHASVDALRYQTFGGGGLEVEPGPVELREVAVLHAVVQTLALANRAVGEALVASIDPLRSEAVRRLSNRVLAALDECVGGKRRAR